MDINLGKATQAIVLAKVRNRISIEFIGHYLFAIAENQWILDLGLGTVQSQNN
jgi:hypothetical protein